ncbi:MAG: SDR family NAD(P)-dependent oxidoreductase [Bradymonadia bacterium]
MSIWHRALDRSVVFSFDRHGFKRHARQFADNIEGRDLSAKNIMVTGCNSGIGFASVEALSAQGAMVYMACRSRERGQAAIDLIKTKNPRARLQLLEVDMADFRSISSVAQKVDRPLHGLVHNAGNMVDACRYTDQDIEYITSLHVAGPFCLSLLLTERLKQGADESSSRIIFVASGGMYTQGLDASELFRPTGRYDGMRHYAHTKRAQVVLAAQLHERLTAMGIGVHSMHPGWVDTPAIRRAMPKFTFFTKGILRTPEQGADTITWLAGHDDPSIDLESGFWFDRGRAALFMSKKVSVPAKEVQAMMTRLDGLAHNAGFSPEHLVN